MTVAVVAAIAISAIVDQGTTRDLIESESSLVALFFVRALHEVGEIMVKEKVDYKE